MWQIHIVPNECCLDSDTLRSSRLDYIDSQGTANLHNDSTPMLIQRNETAPEKPTLWNVAVEGLPASCGITLTLTLITAA
jgi:hypothetical protein